MKTTIKTIATLCLLTVLTFSCKKEDPKPEPQPISGCKIDISKFKDVNWNNLDSVFVDMKFTSSGDFIQNGVDDGEWTLANGCDLVSITGKENYTFLILSVTDDTLKIKMPPFDEVVYHK